MAVHYALLFIYLWIAWRFYRHYFLCPRNLWHKTFILIASVFLFIPAFMLAYIDVYFVEQHPEWEVTSSFWFDYYIEHIRWQDFDKTLFISELTMNNKFISNSVNFIFAFCWLIFFSVFAFEIFNSFFAKPVYHISNPDNIREHQLVYLATVTIYGVLFTFFYREFFLKQVSCAKRISWLIVSLVLLGGCWYWFHNFFKFYWY